jgi:hypothetical protein
MTTASPTDSSVRYTDTIKTRRASSARPTQEQDWSQWELWMASHKRDVLETAGKEAGEVFGEWIGRLEKQIRATETQLAEMRGALDVLRGKGQPGTFNLKGTFNARSVYNRLDVVTHDSSSFAALRDNPGPCPGDGWQMIACGGKRGPAGERGPAGPPGPAATFSGTRFSHRGMEIQTNTGPVSLFKCVAVNPADFSLRFTAADDSTLTISLLPLFKAYNEQTTST